MLAKPRVLNLHDPPPDVAYDLFRTAGIGLASSTRGDHSAERMRSRNDCRFALQQCSSQAMTAHLLPPSVCLQQVVALRRQVRPLCLWSAVLICTPRSSCAVRCRLDCAGNEQRSVLLGTGCEVRAVMQRPCAQCACQHMVRIGRALRSSETKRHLAWPAGTC